MRAGSGVLAIWTEIPAHERIWWNASHSREKLGERVRLPGIQHGCRYVKVDNDGAFFIRYEADESSVFTQDSYRQAVKNPSTRTADASSIVRGFVRGVGTVAAAAGTGAAGYCAALVLQGERSGIWLATYGAALTDRLHIDSDENLLIGLSVTGSDRGISSAPSQERKLRGGQDASFDVVVLVEALDAKSATVALASARELTLERTSVSDGDPLIELSVSGVYSLIHSISETEA